MNLSPQKLGIMVGAALLLAACTLFHPAPPSLPSRSSLTPGQTITVHGNENIYAVARDNNVSMRDIIVLNNLQPPFTLKPGQNLVLPAGSSGGVSSSYGGSLPPVTSAPSGAIEAEPLAPIQSVPPSPPAKKPPNTLGSTVASAPIESLNKPVEPPKPVATTAPSVKPDETAPPPLPATVTPPKVEMGWPVQGPILSTFGPKGQGLTNDGINIGAPKGAPVAAAANGIVAYAGNEMKGFGNLVLIRHQDGWVTAYAHLDRTLVNKDAVVAKGDMIGTVGKTGNVPSPQLHFETRYQGKPVDPSSVITKAP